MICYKWNWPKVPLEPVQPLLVGVGFFYDRRLFSLAVAHDLIDQCKCRDHDGCDVRNVQSTLPSTT